jgi:hypothetical protein
MGSEIGTGDVLQEFHFFIHGDRFVSNGWDFRRIIVTDIFDRKNIQKHA